MSSPFAAVRIVCHLALITIACAFCLLGTPAAAQNQPKDEIFGGYSALFPNGYGDLGFKALDIVEGFDASNTFYLPQAHNFGILVDGSGHFNGNTSPRNPISGTTGTAVGYVVGGLQYKFRTERLSPFARIFIGGASISPDCCGGTRWNFAAGGGGGLDLNLTPRFSIRLVQADYIYSNYDQRPDLKPSPQQVGVQQFGVQQLASGVVVHGTQWNSVRLAAGVVIPLGSYYAPPLSCSASSSPAEVWAGDPVNVTTKGTNFNPKHTLTYAWTANGGKLSDAAAQTATVDTAGMTPGNYSASSTITDPKMRKNNSATCPATFVIKQPHAPLVSCSADPLSVNPNQSSAITMSASDPDGLPLTYSWTASSGQLSGTGTSVNLTPANTDAGTTITVKGTASDNRNPPMTAICTVSVTVPPVKCAVIEDWGECTFPADSKKPWRVDNECKSVLDQLVLKIQNPSQNKQGKVDIVGYADESEDKTLSAQRAVNVRYYLTKDSSNNVDPGLLVARDGGVKDRSVHFYFVPAGCLEPGQAEQGTTIDESQLTGQTSSPWHPEKEKKKGKRKAPAHKKAPPAQ